MTEYGVFNDEGCIESGFYDLSAARQAARKYRAEGDEWAEALAICPDHEEQPAGQCEECLSDDEDDDGR